MKILNHLLSVAVVFAFGMAATSQSEAQPEFQNPNNIPGCQGATGEMHDRCILAVEMLDAYNGTVENPPWGGPAGSNKLCYQNYNESMIALAKLYQQDYARLKAQHDVHAATDAAGSYLAPNRNVQNQLARCLKAPKHLVETPKR